MSSGGEVTTNYDISFEDGTTFSRDSSSGFLAHLSEKGERLSEVELDVTGWTPPRPEQDSREIAKSIRIHFRDFGSQFYVSRTDTLWGKGAVETIGMRLARYRPWYALLVRAVPVICGQLLALPPFFIALAVSHERQVSALLLVVVVLSTMIFIGSNLLLRQYMKHRWLANAVPRHVPG